MFDSEPIPPLVEIAPFISRILHVPVFRQNFVAPSKAASIVYFLYDLVCNSPVALDKLGLEGFVLPKLSLSDVRQAMYFYLVGRHLGEVIGNLSKDQKVLCGLFRLARGLFKHEETTLRLLVAEKAFPREDPRILVEKEALCFWKTQIQLGLVILTDDEEIMKPHMKPKDTSNKTTEDDKVDAGSMPLTQPRKEKASPVVESRKDVQEEIFSDSEDSDSDLDCCYVVNDSPLRTSIQGLTTERQERRNKQDALRCRYKTGGEFYASRPDTWDKCPLTGEKFKEPVVAADGITYEAAAWTAWISENDDSPFVEEPLQHKRSVPNQAIKCAIAVGDSNID